MYVPLIIKNIHLIVLQAQPTILSIPPLPHQALGKVLSHFPLIPHPSTHGNMAANPFTTSSSETHHGFPHLFKLPSSFRMTRFWSSLKDSRQVQVWTWLQHLPPFAELTQGLIWLPKARVTWRESLLIHLDMPESTYSSTEQTRSKGLREVEKKDQGVEEGSREQKIQETGLPSFLTLSTKRKS